MGNTQNVQIFKFIWTSILYCVITTSFEYLKVYLESIQSKYKKLISKYFLHCLIIEDMQQPNAKQVFMHIKMKTFRRWFTYSSIKTMIFEYFTHFKVDCRFSQLLPRIIIDHKPNCLNSRFSNGN